MDEPADNLVQQVSGAAAWSYASMFADRVIRFAVFVIVARLVSPAQFGMVVLSLFTVEALQAVLDVGLATALIRQAAPSKAQLDTAFLLTMGVSGATALALFFGAPPLTRWVHEADAAPLLQALAIAPLLNGAGAVHLALIERDVGFKTLAGRTILSSLLASLAAIGLAMAGFGAWALVGRTLILACSGTAVAWWGSSFRPSLRFDLSAVRDVAPTGLRLWASGLATQVNGRAFDFLAGIALGAAALGALRIAGQTVLLLIELTVGPMTAVGYVLLSRSREDPKLFQSTLITVARLAGLLIFPTFAGLFVVADPLLPLMFGDRWGPAMAVTPYMCVIAPALYWQLLVSVALFAAGRADRMLQWALIESVVTILFGLLGSTEGLPGLALAGAARLYFMVPFGWRWLRRDTGVDPMLLLRPALPSAAASIAMATVVALAKPWLASSLAAPALAAALIALGVAVYLLLLPLWAMPLIRDLVRRAPKPSASAQDLPPYPSTAAG